MGLLQPEARCAAQPRCPSCGLRLADLRDTGRLGCAACYEAFAQALSELIPRIHGFSSHAGKRPGTPAGNAPSGAAPGAAGAGKGSREAPARGEAPAAEAARLRGQLREAIAREDFEGAARLRDRLRELGGGPGPT
jgi:protein arginine kinase activator